MNKLYYRVTNGNTTYETADFQSIPADNRIVDKFFVRIDERTDTIREAMHRRAQKIAQKRKESRT